MSDGGVERPMRKPAQERAGRAGRTPGPVPGNLRSAGWWEASRGEKDRQDGIAQHGIADRIQKKPAVEGEARL